MSTTAIKAPVKYPQFHTFNKIIWSAPCTLQIGNKLSLQQTRSDLFSRKDPGCREEDLSVAELQAVSGEHLDVGPRALNETLPCFPEGLHAHASK